MIPAEVLTALGRLIGINRLALGAPIASTAGVAVETLAVPGLDKWTERHSRIVEVRY